MDFRSFPLVALWLLGVILAVYATSQGWLDAGPGDPEGFGFPVWGFLVVIAIWGLIRRRQAHREVPTAAEWKQRQNVEADHEIAVLRARLER